jgi:hypothetical protein
MDAGSKREHIFNYTPQQGGSIFDQNKPKRNKLDSFQYKYQILSVAIK